MKNLTSKELLARTHALVAEEKRIDLELLDHLREIDRRMLHFEMGYSSLYKFAVEYLGLSEASAYRRIEAMKLAREVPEVREKLESGTISMTNVAAVRTLFRTERKRGKKRSLDEKREVLKQVEGLSKRECERKLLAISPKALVERERQVAPGLTEVKVAISSEMLKELKDRFPNLSAGELIQRALGEMLQRAHDARAPKFAPVKVISKAETRRRAFARAEERCEFMAEDGRRCESKHDLEIDHIRPRAKGGTDAPENLRVLCRAHNGFEAYRILGRGKMERYLPGLIS